MNNIKNILKYSFRLLLIVGFSTFATKVASAKTINQSTDVINDNILKYFENVYEREDYKNYLLASEYVNNGGYNYTTYYYMCLTNEKIDTSNTLNVTSSCEKTYRYYRSNNVYVLEKINDNSITVNNSIYYVYQIKTYIIEKLLISLNIGLFVFYLTHILFRVFKQ